MEVWIDGGLLQKAREGDKESVVGCKYSIRHIFNRFCASVTAHRRPIFASKRTPTLFYLQDGARSGPACPVFHRLQDIKQPPTII